MDNVYRALLSSAIIRCSAVDRLCRITIAIKFPGTCKKNSSPSTFQISISDTGPGTNLSEFLLSNRNSNFHSINGTYFTSPHCWDGELNITTTDVEEAEVQHYQLSWGDSTVLQVGSSSKGISTFSGTEASLSVQGNLEEFIIYIKNLCQKIAILQMPTIALELYLEHFGNSKTWCENLFMSNEGLILPKSMSNIDRLGKGIVDYMINNMQRLDKQAPPPFDFRESFKVGRGSICSLEAITKMKIVFEVVLVLEIAKDANTSCSMEPIVKAKVLYFEEYFPSAITVSMVQALKSVDWKIYGLNMKGIEVDGFGDASIEWEGLQTTTNFDIVLHRYKTEYPSVIVFDSVQFIRHLSSQLFKSKNNFDYLSLTCSRCLKRKKKKCSEVVIVKEALGMALNELKESNPEVFFSQRACKMKTYAPDLSRSISGLIMSSNDMDFKEECAHIVGISLEDLHQEPLMYCINKKIIDIINTSDRNPNKRTANANVETTCEEPSKKEPDDIEYDLDGNRSIWDLF